MRGVTRQQVTTKRDFALLSHPQRCSFGAFCTFTEPVQITTPAGMEFLPHNFFFLGPGLVFHCVTGTQQPGLAHLSEPEWYKAAGQNHTALNMNSLSAAAAIKEVQI